MVEMQKTQKAQKLRKMQGMKTVPHSIVAEQAVLGGLMLNAHAFDKVSRILAEQDFYLAEHRLLYHTMVELTHRNQPFDPITLGEVLKQEKQKHRAVSEAYVFQLAINTPSAANVTAYADIVREHSVRRQLMQISSDLFERASTNVMGEENSLEQLLDEAETRIFHIAEQNKQNKHHQQNPSPMGPLALQHLVSQTIEHLDHLSQHAAQLSGLPTGFYDLDRITAGLQKGDLILIAGRPSMGKTALAMNIVEHVATKTSKTVLVFSLEMSGIQLALRLLSASGRIEHHKMRKGKLNQKEWAHLSDVVGTLSPAPIFVDETPNLGPHELRARARRVAREHGGLGLVLVDYIQLMQVPGRKENRTLEVGEMSRALKLLAKELNVPVVVLSQLNRGLEQRANQRPLMSDLRDSGCLEQDADVIALIYREEVYKPTTAAKGLAEIIIAKQRNGAIGKVRLAFLGPYTRFRTFREDERKNKENISI